MSHIRTRLLLTAALAVMTVPALAGTDGIDTTQTALPFKINGTQIMYADTTGLTITQGGLHTYNGMQATGFTPITQQGSYIQWNRGNGDGATWIANQRGGGAGGIFFGSADTANNFTEQMRIAGSGNVGIGMNNPQMPLDVNGEVVGRIAGTGLSQFRMYAGAYSSMWRNDGGNTYFLLTGNNDPYGAWNGLRPFTISDSSGMVSMGNGATITNPNNVSAGSPASTVSVGGSVQLADDPTCNSNKAGAIKYSGGIFYGCNGVSWTNITANPPANATASTPHCNARTLADGTIQMTKGNNSTYYTTRVVLRNIGYYCGSPSWACYTSGTFVCTADKDGLSESQSDADQYYFSDNSQTFAPWH